MDTLPGELNMPINPTYAAITMEAAAHAASVLDEYIGAEDLPGLRSVVSALQALENDTDFITTSWDVEQWQQIRVTSPRVTPIPPTPAEFDVTIAYQEGWTLSRRSESPPYAIETLDDPASVGSKAKGFSSDDEAWAHVRRLAEAGSAYHRSALEYLRVRSYEAYTWVMGADAAITVDVRLRLLVTDPRALTKLAEKRAIHPGIGGVGTKEEWAATRERGGGILKDILEVLPLPNEDFHSLQVIDMEATLAEDEEDV